MRDTRAKQSSYEAEFRGFLRRADTERSYRLTIASLCSSIIRNGEISCVEQGSAGAEWRQAERRACTRAQRAAASCDGLDSYYYSMVSL